MRGIRCHFLLTLVIVGAMLLAACGATPEPPAPTQAAQATQAPEATEAPPPESTEPVTLRVGTTYIWDTANPAIGWYNYALRYLLYDTLVEEVGISNFVPGLAEDWDVSEDGLVWTFKIREGVTFHDGTPCTAEDVAWSLNWTIENEIETFAFYLANFAEIVALDPTTLQVTRDALGRGLMRAVLDALDEGRLTLEVDREAVQKRDTLGRLRSHVKNTIRAVWANPAEIANPQHKSNIDAT